MLNPLVTKELTSSFIRSISRITGVEVVWSCSSTISFCQHHFSAQYKSVPNILACFYDELFPRISFFSCPTVFSEIDLVSYGDPAKIIFYCTTFNSCLFSATSLTILLFRLFFTSCVTTFQMLTSSFYLFHLPSITSLSDI